LSAKIIVGDGSTRTTAPAGAAPAGPADSAGVAARQATNGQSAAARLERVTTSSVSYETDMRRLLLN
jgi:hypothetical protein